VRWLLELTAVVASVVSHGATPSNNRLLIFHFPDGVRSGHGKIVGTQPFRSGVRFEGLPELLRRCGLEKPVLFDRVSHSTFIYGMSSKRDQRVVACFVRSTYSHFNVGYGHVDKTAFNIPRITDEEPFRRFWANSHSKRPH
jgi:hypothetical protein